MNKLDAARVLNNTLGALTGELLAASDAEVLAAAAELGLNPDMKGSIALVGVTQFVPLDPVVRGKPAARLKSARRRNASPRPPKG